jgi:hypothetical protein
VQYNWTVPAGAVISGSGSSISVTYGPTAVSGNVQVTQTSVFGFSTGTLPVTVNNPTGITIVQTSSMILEAYPNPFHDELTFRIKNAMTEKIKIRINDTRGMNVYSSANEHSTNEIIQIGKDLPSGVFVVQLLYGEEMLVFKIVKIE